MTKLVETIQDGHSTVTPADISEVPEVITDELRIILQNMKGEKHSAEIE